MISKFWYYAMLQGGVIFSEYVEAKSNAMSDTIEPLIIDLLKWIGPESRPYSEVIEAWRTSCPRFPAWEEVTDRGFIKYDNETTGETHVLVSESGIDFFA